MEPVFVQAIQIDKARDRPRYLCNHSRFLRLPEEREKGLGRWLLQSVDDALKDLDNTLRRAVLVCNEGPLERVYAEELGMTRWGREPVGGLVVMHREGQGGRVGRR